MKKYSAILIVIVLLLCFTGCKNNTITQQSSTQLPELNGEYAYLRVKVMSKDTKAKTMQVKVVDFGSFSGVNIGKVPVNTEGELDCSELLFAGGIKEGEWVVSYIDKGQTTLPLTVYSIENIDEFCERVKRP